MQNTQSILSSLNPFCLPASKNKSNYSQPVPDLVDQNAELCHHYFLAPRIRPEQAFMVKG